MGLDLVELVRYDRLVDAITHPPAAGTRRLPRGLLDWFGGDRASTARG